jgi:hypothetical protein
MTFLTSALSYIFAPFIGLGLMLGTALAPEPQAPLGASEAIPTTIAFFETTLAGAISDTATSFNLTSATDKDGTTLASSTYAFVIDEGSANEEIVIADCTSTVCTGAIRGVSVLTGTSSVTALKKSHRRGASVKITDAPILMILSRIMRGIQDVPSTLTYDGAETIATSSNDLVYASWVDSNYGDLFNGNSWIGNQGITGTLTSGAFTSTGNMSLTGDNVTTGTTTSNAGFLTTAGGQCSTASPDEQVCDKAYIDGVAVAGASDSNETTKGIVEEATTAEITAKTATGGTGAKLFVTPAKLGGAFTVSGTTSPSTYTQATTTVTIASGNKYVVYASGVCLGTTQSAGGVVSLYIDNYMVRTLTTIGVYSVGESQTGIPFSMTYASSTPMNTTVDMILKNSGGGCDDGLVNVSLDWIILP